MSAPRRGLLSCALLVALAVVAACGGEDGDDGPQLVVVSHNILHGIGDEDPDAQPLDRFPERLEIIADALAELQPDVIMLQEVVAPAPGDEYPDVRRVLLDALGPEYDAVYGDITGGPIDTGGLGQLTLTRLPIVSAENHHVGGPRAVHRVTVGTDAGTIDLYNAHLEGTEPEPQLAIDEIGTVLSFIEDTRSGTGPVVLAGDFNARPDDPMIRVLDRNGYLDVLVEAGDATCEQQGDLGCTNSTIPLGDNPEHLADQRIDYIFVLPGEGPTLGIREASLFLNEPVDVGSGRLLWASDHIAVRAVLGME